MNPLNQSTSLDPNTRNEQVSGSSPLVGTLIIFCSRATFFLRMAGVRRSPNAGYLLWPEDGERPGSSVRERIPVSRS